jgi:uncharacterized protein (TIGR00297 family)
MIVNHRQQSLLQESLGKSPNRRMSRTRQPDIRLRWQSQLPLFLSLAFAGATVAVQCIARFPASSATIIQAFALGALLAFLTWKLRAATLAAALTGGVFTSALYLATPGWRTALWPLLALLLLTLAATRFGRARKENLGVAESRRGRTASQVSANLGTAVLASLPLSLARTPLHLNILVGPAVLMALAAALAEAAADTLSSELGEVLGGEPFLVTTARRVPAGTDGAVSLAGSLAGLIGAIVVAAAASFAFDFTAVQAAIVAFAAVVGLFVDSFLGAALERRGWLNNDAVNFLSTFASALLAAALGCR